MPELPEVYRVERACNKNLIGKKIIQVETQEDDLVFCEITNKEFEKSIINKTVVDTGRKGKYFWFLLDEKPHPIFHFGMTGDIHFKNQEKFHYRRNVNKDSNEWPPRFWKFTMVLEDPNDSTSQVTMAFTNKRRLARIRLVNSPLTEPPISQLGFDPLHDMLTLTNFSETILKRHCPIKTLLLDQSFSAGVGNWIADEVLYQSKIHPYQYSHTLSNEQITQLHEKLSYVCQTAVEVNAESDLFPKSWLFHYRWNKGNKADVFMPDGNKIIFDTVGGRTTAIVQNVQILNDIEGSKTNTKKLIRRKRKTSPDKVTEVTIDNDETATNKIVASENLSSNRKKSKGTKKFTANPAKSTHNMQIRPRKQI
ncbi:2144_t:CDS:2 [Diversispora eburnea]|uniref:2144_t:CDS:1 n=1 Tax=Diversispora eburnea TaxID=1213867 RepID=A0A9N8YT90_9GLOM|nr:2144_t:CDS:2 [Diversispora eburnea]